MNRLGPSLLCGLALLAFTARAQMPPSPGGAITPPTPPTPGVPTSLMPPLPQAASPVTTFRQLLAAAPAERARLLTNRPPAVRARLLAKVQEYLALSPDDRELRLQATELRWYLTPLMRLPADQREARLATVPAEYQPIVRQRLMLWNILPPAMQQEFLTNDLPAHYFAQVTVSNAPAASAEHDKIATQFNQFFELTPAEKKRTLGTLSPAERAQMEQTLQSFEKMPLRQRMQCIHNYATFAGMSAQERAEFLKNASRWSKLTPQQRQAWRDLVDHVPQWPPMPMPPVPAILMPPSPVKPAHPSVATN